MAKSRKEKVLELLQKAKDKRLLAYRDGWVPGHVIASVEYGGSEGLRRLRQLRADGHEIEKRKKKGTQVHLYRLKDRQEELGFGGSNED